jgi:catechol 2,3-dioxygenase-like lactoylglutathione lyase family enzyme
MSMPRVFRVILPVADIEPAAKFYAELLGQPGMRVSGGRHYFPCGDVMLALYGPKGDGDPLCFVDSKTLFTGRPS